MTQSLVLHIGDPKTGSSSIQQALFRRQVDCPTVAIDYPDKLNAIELANAIRRRRQQDDLDLRYRGAADWLNAGTGDVAVLSAEQFSSIAADEVMQVFGRYMPQQAAEMRVIAYARPHVSRLLSAYAQRVKVGSLQADLASFCETGVNKALLNYHRRFRAWHDLLGDRFTLRPMIRQELRDGDVAADFVGLVVQGAPFTLKGVSEANTTLPVEALSGLMYLQGQLVARDLGGGTLHAVGSRINRLCGQKGGVRGTKLKLSRTMYDRFCEMSRRDAERLDKTFFDRPIMVQAMEQSAADTAEQTSSMDAALYFSGADLARLQALGTALADLVLAVPDVWKESYQRGIGQLIDGLTTADLDAAAQAHIAQVDAIVAELADVIAGA